MKRYLTIFFAFLLSLLLCSAAFANAPADAAGDFSSRVAGMNKVTNVRVGLSDGNVRIVVDSTQPAAYRSFSLPDPIRFAVDIQNAWLASDAPRVIPVKNSSFVKQVRISQFNATTVRIVVDAYVFSDQINLFQLKNDPAAKKPHRLVMDFGNVNNPPKNIEKELEQVKKEIEAEQKKSQPTEQKKSAEQVETVDGVVIDFEIDDELDKTQPQTQPQPSTAPAVISSPIDPKTDTSVLKGKTIVVDAGHGGSDSGAVGPSGLKEKDVTLKVALLLEKQLKEAGANVLLTRRKDVDVASPNATSAAELQARVDVGNNNNADLFLSIHIDSFINGDAHGTSVYIYDDTRLGKCLHDKLVRRLGRTDRGVKFANFYVLRHTVMPASLVELMFISNPEEEQLLKQETTHTAAANALVEGLCAYFAEKK